MRIRPARQGRPIDPERLAAAYDELVVGAPFQEGGDYYERYRSRYESVLQTCARLGHDGPLDVLEVGGGQHALLAQAVLGARATVADLPGPHLAYLESRGVATTHWDLLTEEQPFHTAFDRVFLCEVAAHLPIPPHVYLERLRLALRPGGFLIVTTPNLHRLRNVALLLAGREPWGRFVMPDPGQWEAYVVDLSADQLRWQLERAGFVDIAVELEEFGHQATDRRSRLANLAIRPLTWVPRYRYNLVATARAGV